MRSKSTGAFRRPRRREPDDKLVEALLAVIPSGDTVVDIGAGCGRYIKPLREHGCEAFGIDGTPGINEATGGLVHEADLTGDLSQWYRCAMWGLFIEVGEHVPAVHFPSMMRQLARIATRGMIVSWAGPGQRGSGHVNCRSPVWVASQFAAHGWLANEELTLKARGIVDKRMREKIMVLGAGR